MQMCGSFPGKTEGDEAMTQGKHVCTRREKKRRESIEKREMYRPGYRCVIASFSQQTLRK
jgi:hypothetical protein